MDPVRILSISDYDGLRVSRELLLDREGYRIESVSSSDGIDAHTALGFQIAILCDSVAPQRARHVADWLHRSNPTIRVVRVCQCGGTGDASFDRELDSFDGPSQLLLVIRDEANRVLHNQ